MNSKVFIVIRYLKPTKDKKPSYQYLAVCNERRVAEYCIERVKNSTRKTKYIYEILETYPLTWKVIPY